MASFEELKFSRSTSARDQITKKQLARIEKIYYEASQVLTVKINLLKYQGETMDKFKVVTLKKLQKDLNKEIRSISDLISGIAKDSALEIASAVVEENLKYLSRWGIKLEKAFSNIPDDAVRQIVNGSVYNGEWTLSEAIWGNQQKNIRDIENIVAKGLTQNSSAFEIASNLESYVNPKRKSVKAIDGKKAEYNSMRLVKTMSNHAYQKAYQMVTEPNPFVKAYRWNTSPNHAKVCPLCIKLSTQDEYGLGNGIYPKDSIPLDHPNGRCFITSITMPQDQRQQILLDYVHGKSDKRTTDQLNAFANAMGYAPKDLKNNIKI